MRSIWRREHFFIATFNEAGGANTSHMAREPLMSHTGYKLAYFFIYYGLFKILNEGLNL